MKLKRRIHSVVMLVEIKGVTYYATLPCLPPHLVSRLDCILFYGNDHKICGNKWVLSKYFDDLKKLQNKGIYNH